jgi:hypothetical protein
VWDAAILAQCRRHIPPGACAHNLQGVGIAASAVLMWRYSTENTQEKPFESARLF